MNRARFMEQLEKLLSDISEEERREALEYYESYFDEAGPEKEASVIQELGSPEKVAASIKEDLKGQGEESVKDSEREYRPKPKRGAGIAALIIILLIFLTPFLPEGIGGILAVIILFPLIVILGVGGTAAGLFIGGVAAVAAGIGTCAVNPAVGVLSIGVGCILAAAALVGLVFVVWFVSRLLPGALRWFTDLCNRLMSKNRRGGADV